MYHTHTHAYLGCVRQQLPRVQVRHEVGLGADERVEVGGLVVGPDDESNHAPHGDNPVVALPARAFLECPHLRRGTHPYDKFRTSSTICQFRFQHGSRQPMFRFGVIQFAPVSHGSVLGSVQQGAVQSTIGAVACTSARFTRIRNRRNGRWTSLLKCLRLREDLLRTT